MRYATSSVTEPKLSELLDSAQTEPVFIVRDDQDIAVLVSARQYDRLRGRAAREFNDFCDAVAARAAARGLTEEKLEDLLQRG